MENREERQKNLHEKWQYRTKFGGLYQTEVKEFVDDLRQFTGDGFMACKEAGRIEDYDFNLSVERLRGRRPPEWKLKIDALEDRIQRIENLLSL